MPWVINLSKIPVFCVFSTFPVYVESQHIITANARLSRKNTKKSIKKREKQRPAVIFHATRITWNRGAQPLGTHLKKLVIIHMHHVIWQQHHFQRTHHQKRCMLHSQMLSCHLHLVCNSVQLFCIVSYRCIVHMPLAKIHNL